MGQFVTLTASDGHSFSAWRDSPTDAVAGIVLIQEIFGVNQHIRNMCARFAHLGYAVIAPAVFDRTERNVELGYDDDGRAKGLALLKQVNPQDAILDIAACATALGGKRLGIIGYCFGGKMAWLSATRLDVFSASVSWYGGGIAAVSGEVPKCPVQMHFGEKDYSIPMTDVEAIRAAQPTAEIHVYADAQHGFGCDERATFSAPDAALAQERTNAFFAAHLSSRFEAAAGRA